MVFVDQGNVCCDSLACALQCRFYDVTALFRQVVEANVHLAAGAIRQHAVHDQVHLAIAIIRHSSVVSNCSGRLSSSLLLFTVLHVNCRKLFSQGSLMEGVCGRRSSLHKNLELPVPQDPEDNVFHERQPPDLTRASASSPRKFVCSLLLHPSFIRFHARIHVVLQPLGEWHLRINEDVVCTQWSLPLEELLLHRMFVDQKVTQALVASLWTAFEI